MERSIMHRLIPTTRPARLTAVAALTVILTLGPAGPTAAQQAGHQQHHGAPAAPAESPADATAAMPGMMADMPGMMARMQRMMQEMPADGMTTDHGGWAYDPVGGAFAAINRRMHRDMMVDTSGGADRAFALAMIAHHQGAIDMAKVQLGFGEDPELRDLAAAIIKAQEEEIAMMRAWLERHGN
jgi:uncharacterized protein (DUF305 family)